MCIDCVCGFCDPLYCGGCRVHVICADSLLSFYAITIVHSLVLAQLNDVFLCQSYAAIVRVGFWRRAQSARMWCDAAVFMSVAAATCLLQRGLGL